ncbi:Imm1 family immunity protein [Streptomyces venezuelae]|uniref:Imm1 family immunity protein n=1 Tax=Streptomyces venezuelae TaxID=54571 RepID=UPI00278C6CC8|nr:Imm1 family immunity protein [Streptomyces venezuelae]
MTDGRLEARYRRADMHEPVLVSTEDDVDGLVDALLAGPPFHDAAHLVSRARPMAVPGFPDHELYVGVNRGCQVGALVLSAPEAGFVASVGVLGSRREVVYHVAGQWTEFPADSEIPLGLVRSAVKEFLHSGGGVPTCVVWKPIEMAAEDSDDDQDPWGSSDG